MRFLNIFFALLFFANTNLAQNNRLDSLDKLIEKAATDTAKINLANQKIAIINRINIDSGIGLCKAVIEQSHQLGYKRGEAAARLKLANNYCMKGEFRLANENLIASKALFLSIKDSMGFSDIYSTYGMLYGMQGKYDSSIQVLEKAISIAERNKYDEALGTYYGNIAISYQMQSNFSKTLVYQQKSLDLAIRSNDISVQAYTSLNMGITYTNLGDTNRAKQYLLDAIRLAKKEEIKNVELYAYSNIAGLYHKKEEAATSYEYSMKAAQLAREVGDLGILASTLANAAQTLANMGKFDDALPLSAKAIGIADSSGQSYNRYQAYTTMGTLLSLQQQYKEAVPFLAKSLKVLEETDLYNEAVAITCNTLSLCYEKVGKFDSALSSFKTSSEITDSIHKRENIRKATELTMNYEFEKKQVAQRIEQENKDAVTKSKQLALISIVALSLVLAIVAISAYASKQKANAQLQQQKTEIETTLVKLTETQKQLIQSEKMASLGELTAGIAHEIQNPLNFVNNFSEVSLELLDEMEAGLSNGDTAEVMLISADIKRNLEKINHHGKRADAIVKGMLQHSRASGGAKEPTDLNGLADEYFRLAYHGLRAKNKSFSADLLTDFDVHLPKIKLLPQDIGRVLLNVFNNAFYAVEKRQRVEDGSYRPQVKVATVLKGGYAEVKISDNGTGIPDAVKDKVLQPFFTTKPTGEGTGLGLSLSYDIVVKGHGGKMDINSQEGRYTEFVISIPI